MKTTLAILLLTVSIALGKPPFNYPSAVAYADETINTTIPKEQRIYLFGPEKITETYTLNDAPAKREVEMKRILSYPETDSIASLWKKVELDLKGQWILLLYRAEKPIESVFRLEGDDVFKSRHPLQPGDVILVVPRPKPNEAVTQ